MKPESVSKGTFHRTLQKQTQRHTDGRTQSSDPGINSVDKGGPDQGLLKSEDIDSSQTAEEMTTGIGSQGQPEDQNHENIQDVQNTELMEGLQEATSSLKIIKTGHNGLQITGEEVSEQLIARSHAANMQSVQLANSPPEMLTVPISTAVNPVTTDGSGKPAASAELLMADQPEENGVSQAGAKNSQTSKPPSSFSSVIISRAAEAQNLEESQVQAVDNKNQTTRELAEFENRKLTGEKASVIQSASQAENNPVGRNSQHDTSFQGSRAETPIFKFSELTSQGLSKTEAPAPHVNSQDVFNQIVRKAELMLRQNSSQMKIELQPEFLGKLTIKVIFEEGAVTARFITDNHQVKQMLEANLGMLRQTLENHGLRVERAEVNVQLNNGSLFDGSEGQREWNWDHQYPLNPSGSSLMDSSIYDIPEYLQEDSAMIENYGILANGSLNFLV